MGRIRDIVITYIYFIDSTFLNIYRKIQYYTMIFRIRPLILAAIVAAVSTWHFTEKMSSATSNIAYMNRLMQGAYPTKNSQLRRLDQNGNQVDISSYSLKFQKCQFEMAENEDAGTVLATKHFVIFRLCPSNSCDSCNYGYGEYLVDMEDYLDATIEYAKDKQEEKCDQCEEECDGYYGNQGDGDEEADNNEEGGRRLSSSNCKECIDTCEKIENMEENGYIDATDFVECQEIQNEGDDGNALYAGAMCASNGSKIKIGVFSDDECRILNSELDVENYLADGDGNQMKLSHALLKTTYESDSCLSCLVENDENGKESEVEEVCENLYMSAAKCEEKHGFDDGLSKNYYGYENQFENEETVCDFISSLKSGTYDQDGEIVVGGSSSYHSGTTSTTGGQKFALTFFILGTVGLAVYAAMLHSNLTKSAKSDLSTQGGAMA